MKALAFIASAFVLANASYGSLGFRIDDVEFSHDRVKVWFTTDAEPPYMATLSFQEDDYGAGKSLFPFGYALGNSSPLEIEAAWHDVNCVLQVGTKEALDPHNTKLPYGVRRMYDGNLVDSGHIMNEAERYCNRYWQAFRHSEVQLQGNEYERDFQRWCVLSDILEWHPANRRFLDFAYDPDATSVAGVATNGVDRWLFYVHNTNETATVTLRMSDNFTRSDLVNSYTTLKRSGDVVYGPWEQVSTGDVAAVLREGTTNYEYRVELNYAVERSLPKLQHREVVIDRLRFEPIEITCDTNLDYRSAAADVRIKSAMRVVSYQNTSTYGTGDVTFEFGLYVSYYAGGVQVGGRFVPYDADPSYVLTRVRTADYPLGSVTDSAIPLDKLSHYARSDFPVEFGETELRLVARPLHGRAGVGISVVAVNMPGYVIRPLAYLPSDAMPFDVLAPSVTPVAVSRRYKTRDNYVETYVSGERDWIHVGFARTNVVGSTLDVPFYGDPRERKEVGLVTTYEDLSGSVTDAVTVVKNEDRMPDVTVEEFTSRGNVAIRFDSVDALQGTLTATSGLCSASLSLDGDVYAVGLVYDSTHEVHRSVPKNIMFTGAFPPVPLTSDSVDGTFYEDVKYKLSYLRHADRTHDVIVTFINAKTAVRKTFSRLEFPPVPAGCTLVGRSARIDTWRYDVKDKRRDRRGIDFVIGRNNRQTNVTEKVITIAGNVSGVGSRVSYDSSADVHTVERAYSLYPDRSVQIFIPRGRIRALSTHDERQAGYLWNGYRTFWKNEDDAPHVIHWDGVVPPAR